MWSTRETHLNLENRGDKQNRENAHEIEIIAPQA